MQSFLCMIVLRSKTVAHTFPPLFDNANGRLYQFRGAINSWFRSCLTDRKQTTEVNNVVSEAETTVCGVPQGSVLGPLLFLLYINDIYKSSSLFAFYLFADDTSIILANNNLKELETLVNRELGNVNDWLKANKLSLNIKKIKLCNLSSPAKQYALYTLD